MAAYPAFALIAASLAALVSPCSAQTPGDAPPAAAQTQPEGEPAARMGAGAMGQGGMMGDGGMMGPQQGQAMRMMQGMHERMMGHQPRGDRGPSSQALNGITNRMHQDMAVTFTGNADADFARVMLPHHQAAVDMAKTELAFGTDPDMRKVAEGIVAAQDAEITKLRDWLKQHAP